LFNDLRWKKRILIILGDNSFKSKQKLILDQVYNGLLERDLIVFGLESENDIYNKIKDEEKKKLIEYYSLNDVNTIILIGKDGTIKGNWEKNVSTKEVFDLIDSMPMRKVEIRRRKGEI
jgi:hypothetical protein